MTDRPNRHEGKTLDFGYPTFYGGKAEGHRPIPISEIYGPVIQGEGQVAGVPTVFVRVGGCDYRCSWCDSLYAVLPEHKSTWTKMDAGEVLDAVKQLADPGCLITLSGGNPALYDFGVFVDAAHHAGYRVAIETQGTKFDQWVYSLDSITVSPKPPSSGMQVNYDALDYWMNEWPYYVADRAIKLVVFDEVDYQFAQRLYSRYVDVFPGMWYLQAGTSGPYRDTSTFETMALFRQDILSKLEWLQNRVITDKWYSVRVLPQIHALINGAKRGV